MSTVGGERLFKLLKLIIDKMITVSSFIQLVVMFGLRDEKTESNGCNLILK